MNERKKRRGGLRGEGRSDSVRGVAIGRGLSVQGAGRDRARRLKCCSRAAEGGASAEGRGAEPRRAVPAPRRASSAPAAARRPRLGPPLRALPGSPRYQAGTLAVSERRRLHEP
jgi:hypothetical protein